LVGDESVTSPIGQPEVGQAASEPGPAAVDPAPPGLSLSPRRPAFWIAWVAAGSFVALMNSLSTVRDLQRHGVAFQPWEPFVWEGTSLLATLVVLPALVWLVHRRPWSDRPRAATAAIYAASAVAFSIVHVAGMVALRKVIYAIALGPYVFGSLPTEFLYELRKDAVSFFLIVTVLNLLRAVERRLAAPLLVPTPPSPADERITIRDGARNVVLDSQSIVAVRAAGNYVEVFRMGAKPLMLRATLADVEARLAGPGFARVHRSWLIALAQVQSITASGAGDFRAHLRDGSQAPVSRRYKDAIQHLRS
jgi:DNA-binding LytR/AlgR family response regulator